MTVKVGQDLTSLEEGDVKEGVAALDLEASANRNGKHPVCVWTFCLFSSSKVW